MFQRAHVPAYVPYVPGFRFGRSPVLTSTLGITRFVAFMTKYDF